MQALNILEVFAGVIFVAIVIGSILLRRQSRRRSQQNLALGYERRIGVAGQVKQDLNELDEFLLRITPASIKESVNAKLLFCGKQGVTFVAAELMRKYTLLLIGLMITVAVLGVIPSAAGAAAFLAIGLFFVPDLRLVNEAKERKEQIGNLLPDALDQLTLLVDSGLDFQTAFVRVCRNSSGFLNDEFQRTLADLQLGITRKDAFENLGVRTGSPVLKNFARAMVLADLFGVPVSSVLRTQAQDLRNARRARAEEEAQKVPTKITFPLVACLLPVILILMIGPSILNLLATFK